MLLIVFAFVTNGARAADWTDANNVTYTALKSINGGGLGYIAMEDIVPSGKDTVKFKYKPSTVTGNECIYCSRYANGNYMKSQFCGFRISSAFRVDSHSHYKSDNTTYMRQYTCNTTKPLTAGTEYTLSADYYNAAVTINGTSQTLSGDMVKSSSEDYTPGSILVLLASHTSSSANATSAATLTGISNLATGDLYYFQLWSYDGTLSHNFMPAKCDSDSAVGLYDTVTGKFYPATEGSLTGATYDASERAGKKWTGLGGDNKMSTGANWEGGVAPQAGDSLDFTLAAPFAALVADIEVTFGKIYLGAGDLPAFAGALTATAINDLEGMTAYDTETDGFAFTLDAPSGQNLTWNGGAAANWNTTDASWLYNNADSVWYDHNNAIFNTADAIATLTADATANSLTFTQNATVAGSATLTVPTVSVAADVSATISAPTAGALAKIGAGTLTLTENRTDAATTLSEGTLELSGTASLDWTKFTFGTDAAKPVTLEFGEAATLASVPATWYIGNIAGITSTVVKNGGDWRASTAVRVGSAAGTASFYHKGGSLTTGRLIVGDDNTTGHAGTGYAEISGGTVTNTGTSTLPIIGCYSDGTVVVTNRGHFVCNGNLYMGYTESATGILTVVDGGIASIAKDICICSQETATGILNIKSGGTLRTALMAAMGSGTPASSIHHIRARVWLAFLTWEGVAAECTAGPQSPSFLSST